MSAILPRQRSLGESLSRRREAFHRRIETALGSHLSLVSQITLCALVFGAVVLTGWLIHDEFQLTPLFLCLISSLFLALFTDGPVTLAYSFLSACAAQFLFLNPLQHVDLDVHFYLRLVIFVGASMLVNTLVGRLRDAYGQSTEDRRAAERANREKDEIIAILSHDLRAPLTSALLSIQLIERQVKASPEHQDLMLRHTERALEACRRVNGLVLDLLDSSKASAGGLSLHRDPHQDLATLARSVAEELRVVANQHEIKLDASGVADSLPLECDANRVKQIVANLVGNALKFTPRGGSIRIAAVRSGDFACLTVSDTGMGISPEQRSHLFERFWQAERSNRTGVGLGLFIVKAIVDAHGGRILVESEPNRGTTFTVELPVKANKNSPLKP